MSFLFFLRWSLYHPVIISSFLFFQVDALPPCLLQIYIILRQKKLFPSLRSNIFKIVGAPPPPPEIHIETLFQFTIWLYICCFSSRASKNLFNIDEKMSAFFLSSCFRNSLNLGSSFNKYIFN